MICLGGCFPTLSTTPSSTPPCFLDSTVVSCPTTSSGPHEHTHTLLTGFCKSAAFRSLLIGRDAGGLCGRHYFVDGCLQMNAALRCAAKTPTQPERVGFEGSRDYIAVPLLSTRSLLLLWFVFSFGSERSEFPSMTSSSDTPTIRRRYADAPFQPDRKSKTYT